MSASHDDGGGELAGVEGVQRLAQVEHDVVGDVDGQGDGPHTCGGEAVLHPGRGRGGRVDAAHEAGDVAVAAGAPVDGAGVLGDDDVEAAFAGRRQAVGVEPRVGGVGGVGETGTGGVGVLAGHTAHGETVAAVRGHVDLQDLLPQAEDADRVGSGGWRFLALVAVLGQPLLEHDDAGVVLPDAELTGRADHAVGDMAVGLARGDAEVTGKDGAGQADHDVVTDVEVVGAADDAAAGQLGGLLAGAGGIVVLGADVDAAVVDDLAVGLLLGLAGEDLADDERTGDGRGNDALLLQAHPDEVGGELLGTQAGGNIDVLAQPFNGDVGHVSFPFRWCRTAGRSGCRPRRCRACRRCRGAA